MKSSRQRELKKRLDPTWLHKVVVGALRETIQAHGPIDPSRIGSAAKRIVQSITRNDVKTHA